MRPTDTRCRAQNAWALSRRSTAAPIRNGEHMATATMTRKDLITALNGDLAREYQAVIAYVVYSQVLKGAQYMAIAKELEKHATQELEHALKISKHIDYLGGTPTTNALEVKMSDDPRALLRF